MAYTFGQASKGTTQEENKNVQQSGYVFGQASKNTQNPVVQEEETPGFVQGVAQAAAKPFLGFASQGRDIATEATNLPRVIKGEKPIEPKGEYDYGYFGKVKSFGEMTPDKAGVKAAISGAGAGLGAASFLPIGGALSTIGKNVVTRTLPSTKILAAEGASAGFLQGLGSATQDKKGLKETAEETAVSTVGGGVLGPVVGKTVGGVSKVIGDQVVKLTQPLETHKARVAQNIHRALSTQGKKSIGVSLKTPEKQYRAFEVLRDLAPNIDVIDNTTGETIKWEPKTTDFQQFGQALAKGKETVWKGVTNAVKEATGKDLQVDILPIVDDMNKIAGDPFRTPEVRRAAQLYSEQLVQMSDVTGKAPLEGVMTFNKDLNTKIGGVLSGTTDNVVRDLEAGLAKKLSENTDNAVETIAGKEFAKLKDDYSALKTIEKDAVRRMQQELRMTDNSLGDMVGRYGNIEIVNGLIQATQGNVGPLAKGVGLKIMGAYTKKLRQPSTYLQKAFREIDRYKSGEGLENAAVRGVKTVKETLKKNPKNKTLVASGLVAIGTANQKAKAEENSDFDWEAKTTEVKSRYGLPSGKTIFERKKITHPDNLSKFEELYNQKIPNDVKKVIDAIAYNESVDGKYRVNKGDQKDKSDSVGLLHMGKDAVAEFNKRKEYFGYTGPDINIKDLTGEEADIIQKFIQASRIVRDMEKNKRSLLDATTFIQNPGEKNYGEKVMKKIKSKL